MSRETRPPQTTRSEHWLRVLINHRPDLLAMQISATFGWPADETITWLSPLVSDGYAEYRDDDFLSRLGIQPSRVPLAAFWPRRGPRWDGLGRTASARPLLVEGKAHIEEAVARPCGAGPRSQALIR